MRKKESTSTKTMIVKYLLALGLLGTLAIAEYFTLREQIRENESSAAILNVSSRQRTLVERFAFLAKRTISIPIQDEVEHANLLERMTNTVRFIEISHHALIYGNPNMNLPGKPSPTLRMIYFKPPMDLDKKIRTYLSEAKAFIQTAQERRPLENLHYLYVVNAAVSSDLIPSLHALIKQYQTESEQKIARLQHLARWILVSTLLLMILTALFIFQPMVRQVRKEHAALKREKDIAQTYLNIAGAMFIVVDKNEKVILINQKGCEILGCSEQDILGKNWFDHFIPDNIREESRKAFHSIVNGQIKVPDAYESLVLTTTGDKRIILLHSTLVRDEDGNISALLSSGQDITERKKAEQITRRRTEKVIQFQSTLLELSKISDLGYETVFKMLSEADAKTLNIGRVSFWFFDESRSEIICEDLFKLVENTHDKGMRLQARQYPRYFEALERSRTIAADDAHQDPRTSEFSEGYLKPLGINSMMDIPIRRYGIVVGIVCHEHTGPKREWTLEEQDFASSIADLASLNLEISERRRAEEALKKSESRLRLMVEQMPAILWTTDTELRFTSGVGAGLATLNLISYEMVGKSLFDYFKTDDVNFLPIAAHLRALKGESVSFEQLWTEHVFQTYIEPLRDVKGKIIGCIGIALDVTERKQAEKALQESEERYRRIIETAEEGIWIINAENKISFVNNKMAEMLGFNANEMIQSQLFTFMDEEGQTKMGMRSARWRQGIKEQYDFKFRRKDGTDFWGLVVTNPIFDKSGKYTGALCMISDITKRKKTEDELLRRFEQLQTIYQITEAVGQEKAIKHIYEEALKGLQHVVNADRASILLFDPDGVMRFKAWEGLSDQYRKTVEGHSPWSVDTTEAHPILVTNVEEEPSLEKFKDPILNEGIRALAFVPILGQNRLIGKFMLYYNKIHAFSKEEIQLAQNIASNIGFAIERRRTEDALRKSEAKNRALLNVIPDMMFRINKEGTFLDFKLAKDQKLPLSPKEIVGKDTYEILPFDLANQIMLNMNRALLSGDTQIFEYQLLLEGTIRDYEARIVVCGEDEVLAIVRDITERKKMERMKNEFISTISHELKTPLTSIRGSLEIIAGGMAGEISSNAKKLVSIAKRNSDLLSRLISDILDVERIESGKMIFKMQPLELMPLIEQTIEANRVYGDQYEVEFVLTNVLPNVTVNIDYDRFIQVMTNLLSNAAKFSPPQEKVEISVSRHDKNIRISVTDHGSGIPKEFRNRIFERFAQADPTDARHKQGAGLGLSIVKAIVERLGGIIGFESENSIGTTFYFELPEYHRDEITAHGVKSKKRPNILICEDDPDVATLLSLILRKGGYHTEIAYDATQAKNLLNQNNYSAMTLDIKLPDQDGISLIKELAEQEHTRNLPIVVVSANTQQWRSQLNDSKFSVIDWLDKPIDQNYLLTVMQKICPGKG